MASTESIVPPGIYRIIQAGVDGATAVCLTFPKGGHVTVLPLSAQPDPDQEWQIHGRLDGNVVITRPGNIFPAKYLTCTHEPDRKPGPGDRIVVQVAEFPPNEWEIGIAPGFRYTLRFAETDLGIRTALPIIFPPFLELAHEGQFLWIFEFVRKA